jgi:hypothetical protein
VSTAPVVQVSGDFRPKYSLCKGERLGVHHGQCFIQAFARGACPPRANSWPPRKNERKFFSGALPQTPYWGAVAYLGGSVRAIAPPSERRKIFLCVCVWAVMGGREERREDVEEGRSGDWLEIAEMRKKEKRSSKNFTSTFGVRWSPSEKFFCRRSVD